MALPDLPRWATATGVPTPAATVEEPPDVKKTSGWLDGDAVPAGWLDWLFFNIYAWIYYWKNGRDKDDGYPYNSADPPTFEVSVPLGAKVVGQTAGAAALVRTNVLKVESDTVGAMAIGCVAVDGIPPFNVDDSACVTITGFEVTYKRVNAGDVLDAELISVNPDTGVGTLVARVTNADANVVAALTLVADPTPPTFVVSASMAFYVRLEVTPFAAVTDCSFSTAKVIFKKTRVE